MFKKLKDRWGLKSNFQVVMVLFVFAITGSLAVKLAYPFLRLIGIRADNLGWFYYVLKVLIIFPIYQILLLIVGTTLGQFTFFWNFEKKMLVRLKLGKLVAFVEKKFMNK